MQRGIRRREHLLQAGSAIKNIRRLEVGDAQTTTSSWGVEEGGRCILGKTKPASELLAHQKVKSLEGLHMDDTEG